MKQLLLIFFLSMNLFISNCFGAEGGAGAGVSYASGLDLLAAQAAVEPEKGSDGKWHCDICDKSSSSKVGIKVHIRFHTGEKPFVCDFTDCGKCFYTQGHLTEHKDSHDKKRIECPYCDTILSSDTGLKRHMKRICKGITKDQYAALFVKKKRFKPEVLESDEDYSYSLLGFECNSCGTTFCHRESLENHSTEGFCKGVSYFNSSASSAISR